MSKIKISKKWREMAEIYKKFLEDDWIVDLSEESAQEMYLHESLGGTLPPMTNGYYVGKKWMDVFIIQYKKDIKEGLLFAVELREDFPDWWLIKVGIL